MPNLKEVRNRISSVNSTMQITSAMKVVSAAKLRKAQDAVTQMRPYSEKMTEILGNLTAGLESSENPLLEERDLQKVLIVAISSNRGLCGAFNANIVKRTKLLIANDFQNAQVTVLTAGKKVFDAFKKTDYFRETPELPLNYASLFDDLSFQNVSELANTLMDLYSKKQFDKVVLVYNHFKNAAVQEVRNENFLPLLANKDEAAAAADYIFEPGKTEILENLIPKALKTQLYKAFLDSHASEHGARMTSMHKATDNAKELLGDLKLSYNKARQAAITTEILEIVAGAEALDG